MSARKPSASRHQRSKQELDAAAEHLRYELDMFESTAHALMSGIFEMSLASNSLLESFAIHVRTLLHFFFPVEPRADDMLAEDYFDDPDSWLELRGGMPDILSRVRFRVGKDVAHLTYARLEVEPHLKRWDVAGITVAMQGVIETFERSVPLGRDVPRSDRIGS